MLGNRVFTERLILRRIEEGDLRLISDWSQSAAAYGDYLTPENCSFQECYDLWKNNSYWNEHAKVLVIELKEESRPVGTIRFWQKQNDHTTSLVALKIAEPSFRGQGLGTEAQLGLINYLFKQNHQRAVEMFTDIDNVPEQRCLEKLGFTFVEVQTYEDQDIERQGRLYRLQLEEYDRQLLGYI